MTTHRPVTTPIRQMPTFFVVLVAVWIVPALRGAEKVPLQLGDLYRVDQVTYPEKKV